MSGNRLTPAALSQDVFAEFGEVIETDGRLATEINYGQTLRFDDLATIDVAGQGGRTLLSIFRSKPVSLPFPVRVMEYHPLGSQAFMPLHNRPFLVAVAPAAEHLDFKLIQGFFTNGEQGVNIHKGTWHHYQLSLDEISDYLVIDRSGPGNNRVEHRLENTLFIEEFR